MELKLWTKIGEPIVLAAKFGIKLLLQKFLTPKGEEKEFSQFWMKDSSFVFPITKEGKIITVRQYKQGRHAITHELPAGICDPNEHGEVTATRELLEETGYQAGIMIYLGPIWPDSRCGVFVRHTYLALGCEKVAEPKTDPEEEIEVVLLSMKEWLELVLKGDEVAELTTLGITLKALIYLWQHNFIELELIFNQGVTYFSSMQSPFSRK